MMRAALLARPRPPYFRSNSSICLSSRSCDISYLFQNGTENTGENEDMEIPKRKKELTHRQTHTRTHIHTVWKTIGPLDNKRVPDHLVPFFFLFFSLSPLVIHFIFVFRLVFTLGAPSGRAPAGGEDFLGGGMLFSKKKKKENKEREKAHRKNFHRRWRDGHSRRPATDIPGLVGRFEGGKGKDERKKPKK